MSTKPFHVLIAELQAFEDAPDSNPEAMAACLKDLSERIDEVKIYTDDLRGIATVRIAQAKELLDFAKARQNEADRILARMQFFMEAAKFEQLPGRTWDLEIKQNGNPEVLIREEFLEANLEMMARFPKFVKRDVSFAWDKKAIVAACKEAKTDETEFAKLKYNKSLKFKVKK